MLEVRNVSKQWIVKNQIKRVIHNLSFSVETGDHFGIVGKSGCGKSTLLRSICGFETIDKGEILFDEKKIIAPQKEVLMVFQEFNQIFPWKTVIDNIVFSLLTARQLTKERATQTAREKLHEVGLLEQADVYPACLSGGMKQRAALARVLALRPRLLLLDEPFAALDYFNRREMQRLLKEVCSKYAMTTIFVTHDINEVIKLSDRILLCKDNLEYEIVKNIGNKTKLKINKIFSF